MMSIQLGRCHPMHRATAALIASFWLANAVEKLSPFLGFTYGKPRLEQFAEVFSAIGFSAGWAAPFALLCGAVQGAAGLSAALAVIKGPRSKCLRLALALGVVQMALFIPGDVAGQERVTMLKHLGYAVTFLLIWRLLLPLPSTCARGVR